MINSKTALQWRCGEGKGAQLCNSDTMHSFKGSGSLFSFRVSHFGNYPNYIDIFFSIILLLLFKSVGEVC